MPQSCPQMFPFHFNAQFRQSTKPTLVMSESELVEAGPEKWLVASLHGKTVYYVCVVAV